MYYALVALSIGGLIILRRRRVPILPLLAVGLDVAVSVAVTFGQTRYRSTFEVALVLAAAVQLDWIWGRRGRSRTVDDHGGDEPGEAGTGDDGAAMGRLVGVAAQTGDGPPGPRRPRGDPGVAPAPTGASVER